MIWLVALGKLKDLEKTRVYSEAKSKGEAHFKNCTNTQ